MTRTIRDISRLVSEDLPVWPGDPPVVITRVADLGRGDDANVTAISLSAHAGTHVDAPAHYLPHGLTVDQLPLDALIGPAVVADVSGVRAITPAVLDALGLVPGTKRLLLRTWNDRVRTWPAPSGHSTAADRPAVAGRPAVHAPAGGGPDAGLDPDNDPRNDSGNDSRNDLANDPRNDPANDHPIAALTAGGARWIVAHGLRLVGIDGPSIAAMDQIAETHVILLGAGVIPLEGLDLGGVVPGGYHLVCLPLKVAGADGAPARAVLIAGSVAPLKEGEE